jgi:hypothetical protein
MSQHNHGCDCHEHCHVESSEAKTASRWAGLLPLLACSVCPACLALYAKIFGLVGVGFGLSEDGHGLLLLGAFAVYLSVAVWTYRRTRQLAPLLFALSGAAVVGLGHFAGYEALELGGIVVLVSGSVWERLQLRAARRRAADASARAPIHVH